MSAPAGSLSPPPDLVPVRRALLSVSDKTGLIELSRGLAGFGVELLSTGGSAGDLRAAGLSIREVSDLTGFPEIMDGRIKTLHPRVHGGLLARRDDAAHRSAMVEHGIEPIDLLAVNLYPFEEVRTKGADEATSVENIDIGGPAMIRAAAKNSAFVAVVTDPGDYAEVLAALKENGGALPFSLRRALAAKAFARTAAYDAAIAGWFADALGQATPRHFSLAGRLAQEMRYGENPHQRAALYLSGEPRPGAALAQLIQGKALSFNNVADADAAFELAAEFEPSRAAAAVVVKHGNPCGAAEGVTLEEAYRRALACDPVSAFGGVVALNRALDADAARAISEIFTEVIVAPDASDEAKAILAEKKNLRLLLAGALPDPRAPGRTIRPVAGGFLLQDRDNLSADDLDLRVVTKRAPSKAELADLRFAFRVAKHVKSNAIVYAKGGATVGIGAGQMSRVDSSRIAALKAQDAARAAGEAAPGTQGSAVASDAFFPFADGLLAAVEAGATAVIQPGGSMRDAEVIAAADAHGIAMVFTGIRHFRH